MLFEIIRELFCQSTFLIPFLVYIIWLHSLILVCYFSPIWPLRGLLGQLSLIFVIYFQWIDLFNVSRGIFLQYSFYKYVLFLICEVIFYNFIAFLGNWIWSCEIFIIGKVVERDQRNILAKFSDIMFRFWLVASFLTSMYYISLILLLHHRFESYLKIVFY